MAKIAFSKLKLKTNETVVELALNDDLVIEVKQYLPIQEKLGLIGRVVEYAHMEDANFSNPVKAAALRDLEVVFNYTNLTFTDKQKEDIPKLYDLLYSTGIMQKIIEAIPANEYQEIVNGVEDTIEAIYQYSNSAVGIFDAISQSQSDAAIDIETIQQGLAALQNSPLFSSLAPALGLE